MSEEAENTGQEPGAEAAPAQAPQIPKWRFDEVLARTKALSEELEIKNRILDAQRLQQQGPQKAAGPTAEELGLEPQTMAAVQKLAEHMFNEKMGKIAPEIKGALATAANKTEQLQFLVEHGKDKTKLLPQIKEEQTRHFNTTGGYISVEHAYLMLLGRQMLDAPAKKPASTQTQNTPANAQTQVQAEDTSGAPDAAQTRAAGSQGGAKAFHELTMEEQEAILDRQLSGATL